MPVILALEMLQQQGPVVGRAEGRIGTLLRQHIDLGLHLDLLTIQSKRPVVCAVLSSFPLLERMHRLNTHQVLMRT